MIFGYTSDCKCFSCTCLSICKNCSIVTLEHICNNRCRSIIIDLLLIVCPIKDGVKGELLWRFVGIGSTHKDFSSFLVQLNDDLMTFIHFIAAHGSASNAHLDTFSLCLFWRSLHFFFLILKYKPST